MGGDGSVFLKMRVYEELEISRSGLEWLKIILVIKIIIFYFNWIN